MLNLSEANVPAVYEWLEENVCDNTCATENFTSVSDVASNSEESLFFDDVFS